MVKMMAMIEMMLMMEMILMMVIEKRIDLLENELNELADKLIQVNLLLMVIVVVMMLVTIKMVKWSHVPYN